MYRGSRKHVLDWTSREEFPSELLRLVSPCPVEIGPEARWMPRGFAEPDEARLERFGPRWLPEHPAWTHLRDWWLVHKRWANTPNWDLAVGCTVEGRPGLVLMEAKANHPELNPTGKRLRKESSSRSTDNHQRIGEAIQEANLGCGLIDGRVNISRDSHYQLANRLAFTWKLGTLGIPVVLVFLGFIGDEGIRDVGPPFADEEDWSWALSTYFEGVWPPDLLKRRIDLGPAPVWVISRSRPVLGASPPREAGRRCRR